MTSDASQCYPSVMATTPHGGCIHPDAKVDPDFECGVCPACRRMRETVLWEPGIHVYRLRHQPAPVYVYVTSPLEME